MKSAKVINRDAIVLFIRLKFKFLIFQCPAPLWVLSLTHKLVVESKGILEKDFIKGITKKLVVFVYETTYR